MADSTPSFTPAELESAIIWQTHVGSAVFRALNPREPYNPAHLSQALRGADVESQAELVRNHKIFKASGEALHRYTERKVEEVLHPGRSSGQSRG